MSLTNLPAELFDEIIEFSLPDGFEALATTNKGIYERCKPFVVRHNELRFRFRDFHYAADGLIAASDLIRIIANERRVARYIRKALLANDSYFVGKLPNRPPNSLPTVEEGGPIVQIFAESPHLQQSGVDWEEYYNTFAEDVRAQRYSQYGSVFLLTLLANVEELTLPTSWTPSTATQRLLDVIVNKARKPRSASTSSCLGSVARLYGRPSTRMSLSWASLFLALPNLETFSTTSNFAGALEGNLAIIAFQGSPHVAEKLSTAYLYSCCIDGVGIAKFLKDAPCLTTLHYTHIANRAPDSQDWDLCSFMNAVAREAGSHLLELCVRIVDLPGAILPGKATACFQKLQRLEFPLDYVVRHIQDMDVTGDITTPFIGLFRDTVDPFVRNLLPQSLIQLSLLRFDVAMGIRTEPYNKALLALFRRFRMLRNYQLRNLQELYITRAMRDDTTYNHACNEIVAEGGRVGVRVNLEWVNHSRSTPGWNRPM